MRAVSVISFFMIWSVERLVILFVFGRSCALFDLPIAKLRLYFCTSKFRIYNSYIFRKNFFERKNYIFL